MLDNTERMVSPVEKSSQNAPPEFEIVRPVIATWRLIIILVW
jgi:hypothetical protein